MILLDTTVFIDMLRGDENIVKLLQGYIHEQFYTTEINIFELFIGVYAAKKNPESHLFRIYSLISKINILQLDRKSSLESGKILGNLIKQGKTIQRTDCLIAGISLTNGISDIITSNKKDFENINGVNVISY